MRCCGDGGKIRGHTLFPAHFFPTSLSRHNDFLEHLRLAPNSQSDRRVVLLDMSEQRKMAAGGDRFVQLTPESHFSRKNIGYLYAIRHGAEFIWDFGG